MKTPRELLIARHRDAGKKLDLVRQRALEDLLDQKAERTSNAAFEHRRPGWLALLLQLRWHLAGLSAAWLIILLLNVGNSSAGPETVAKTETSSPNHILASLCENRRMLSEWSAPPLAEASPV